MNSRLQNLILLDAKLDSMIEFQYPYDDEQESHGVRNTAIGAGVLGAGYAGGSLYRGAKIMQGQYGGGLMPSNLGQASSALGIGHRANMADVSSAWGATKGAASTAAGATEDLRNSLGAGFNTARGKMSAGIDAAKPYITRAKNYAGGVADIVGHAAGNVRDFKGVGMKTGKALEIAGKNAFSRFRGLRFSSAKKLIELNARLESLISFDDQDNEYVGRYVLGSPLYSAMTARKGKRLAAFGSQTAHSLGQTAMGAGIGAGAGAAIGAAGALLTKGKHGSREVMAHLPGMAAGGAILGGSVGMLGGCLKGNFDQRSTDLMRKYR